MSVPKAQPRRSSVVPGGGEDDAPSTCELCRYWEAFDEDLKHFQYGSCRRHAPPAMRIAKPGEYEARWATTEASEWCGEYRPHSPQVTSR